MAKSHPIARDAAQTLAIQALTFIAQDPERLERFLALSGIAPEAIREAAAQPGFLAGVFDHLATDERLLVAFASEAEIDAAELMRARNVLAGEAVTGD